MTFFHGAIFLVLWTLLVWTEAKHYYRPKAPRAPELGGPPTLTLVSGNEPHAQIDDGFHAEPGRHDIVIQPRKKPLLGFKHKAYIGAGLVVAFLFLRAMLTAGGEVYSYDHAEPQSAAAPVIRQLTRQQPQHGYGGVHLGFGGVRQ